MKRNDFRSRRTGSGVPDWTPCIRFLESVCTKQIESMFEQFLRDHTHLRGSCRLVSEVPPRIVLEFSRVRVQKNIPIELSDEDMSLILGLLYRLVSKGVRRNLAFSTHSGNRFHPIFLVHIRDYRPFMAKQTELDIFGAFGGAASPPDYSSKGRRPKYPYDPPFFAKDLQMGIDVDALGPLPSQWGKNWKERTIVPWFSFTVVSPRIIFSDTDPEGEDDIPFDFPTPVEIWEQIELQLW